MISKQRLADNFDLISQISGEGEGITRIAFSEEDWGARTFVIKLMEEAGLAVRFDNFGNVIGRREGVNPDASVVMCGSHIDSVPNGGNFDGIVGVLGAIEMINAMNENNFANYHPIEVVVFMCEESSRFGISTIGSKVMRGKIDNASIKKISDNHGHSLYSILKLRGLDADNIESSVYHDKVKAFLELHIEQGRVLEEHKKKLGIVTGISAPTRLRVNIIGKSDHSGATPMELRHDALCAASEIILAAERAAIHASKSENPVVATVGHLDISPGVMNVIPGKISMDIDIRSMYLESRIKTAKTLMNQMTYICEQRDLALNVTTLSNESPVMLNEYLIDMMEEICQDKNLSAMRLSSGAGHDAMHWASYAPTGMIFIPCRDGVSHSAEEWADMNDIVSGTRLLYHAIKRLSADEAD